MSSTSALDALLGGSSSTNNTSDGINLSSILAATSGNTAAIDVTSAVDSAIYAARAPERVWEGDQTTLSNETSAIDSIQTATQAIYTDLESLNSLTGPFSGRTVSSSSTAVSATAATGSATGNHTVAVTSLATTASAYSTSETSATTALPTSSITITTSSGSTNFNTGTGNAGDNLNDLATAINAASLGVTASVITDDSGSRLALVANTSGAAANFSVTSGSTSFAFTQPVTGADASLTVDGVPITSATNTVTGVISGVTLNLTGTTAANQPATLSVAANTSEISAAINQFVTDYNTAIGLVNTQFTVGSAGTEGVLAADSTITNLQSTLQNAINYAGGSGSGTINSLNALGITENSTTGALSVNNATLNSALANNLTDVQNFFTGSALNGYAATFATALNVYTEPGTGAFTVDLSGITSQQTDLTNEINNFETNYISNLQTNLTSEYNGAESALQSLPTQLKQIQAELGNNSGSGS